MACCILTAFLMNRLIKACDIFDIRFLEIRYNDADEDVVLHQHIVKAITTQSSRIAIEGMTCSACSTSIEKELQSMNGVFRASVSLALSRTTVSYNTNVTTPKQLVDAIESLGYKAKLGDRSHEEMVQQLQKSEELQILRAAITSASICAILVLSLERAMPFSAFKSYDHLIQWLVVILATKVQSLDAWPIHRRAWTKEGRKTATMDTLLSLSLLCGLGLTILQVFINNSTIDNNSYTSSGAFLTIIVLAGRYLETVLRREADSNLAALYDIQTQNEVYQLIKSDIHLPASLINVGDNIAIGAGQLIPCDCYIVNGSSAINEATITGEALPVMKNVGDFLLAGTRNITRELAVAIIQDQSKSSLAKVIEGVSTATEQRRQGTESLDVLMRSFVSGVITLAGLTFVMVFYRLRNFPFVEAFTVASSRAMTILAAACPCGIGLATPSAALAGIDAAYAHGCVLSGGIRTMEAMNKITHVVMDKTGTLTTGRLSVVQHHFSEKSKLKKAQFYQLLLAAEVEDAKTHPVARAIFKWALSKAQETNTSEEPFTVPKTHNLQQTLGKGVSCEVQTAPNTWINVLVGTHEFLTEHAVTVPTSVESTTQSSTVFFAFNSKYAGYLVIHDTIRAETPLVVTALVDRGINVTMLTGDAAPEAHRVSKELNIPVLASRASPSDKLRYVQELQRQGHRVAMVGDGINDVLAQAVADVGVSISLTQGCLAGAGSVVITSGNLRALVRVFEVSRRVVEQARWNIRWAVGYNVVALSLAVGDWVTPAMAGSMMAFSSISVLSMSLWLRYCLRNTQTIQSKQ